MSGVGFRVAMLDPFHEVLVVLGAGGPRRVLKNGLPIARRFTQAHVVADRRAELWAEVRAELCQDLGGLPHAPVEEGGQDIAEGKGRIVALNGGQALLKFQEAL